MSLLTSCDTFDQLYVENVRIILGHIISMSLLLVHKILITIRIVVIIIILMIMAIIIILITKIIIIIIDLMV